MMVREPKVVVATPTLELAASLFLRLRDFPGEKSIGVELPHRFEVELIEFPTETGELDEVLDAVRAWLDEVGLESVTVHAEGRAYELRRSNGS
jgi:hypothetical protein